MNTIVLYGDYTTKSRERLQKFLDIGIKRGWEVKRIDTEGRLGIDEQLSNVSLFEKENLFVLEDATRLTKKDTSWLAKNEKKLSLTLIIYHDGGISEKILDGLPKNSKIEEFKLPRLIFSFLESIYPKNAKKSLSLLHELIKNEPMEFIFALLSRYLRDLFWVKIDSSSLPYPSWRIAKLKKQSSFFSESLLRELLDLLAEADIKSKTSKTDLIASLDLILTTKLE